VTALLAAFAGGAVLAGGAIGLDATVSEAGVRAPVTAAAQTSSEAPSTTATIPATTTTTTTTTSAPARTPDQLLAAALGPIVASRTGAFSVSIVDQTTGRTAGYNAAQTYPAASVVKVDILATLLLRKQSVGAHLTDAEDELATAMIESSDNDAASMLWDEVGGAIGVAGANRVLGLTATNPDTDDYWGMTTTTVVDQLTLLRALATANSPLSA